MIPAVAAVLYAAGWLVTARILYGRWRGVLKRSGSDWCDGCYKKIRRASDTEVAWRSHVAALVWPLTLLAFLITFRPPPTAAERAEVQKRLKARVAELERELGIGS